MKIKILLLLTVLLCLTSCATVFNRKEYGLNLKGTQPDMKVKVYDSIYELPATVKVKRSKHDLPITVMHKTDSINAVIEPGMSPTFFYANLWLIQFSPLSYAGDMFSQKRFYYGRNLVLDDTTAVYKPSVFNPYREYFGKKYYGEKGQWNIIVGMPYGNLFYMQPRNLNVRKNGGFFGLQLGVEYFYRPRRFVQARVANAIDFIAPVPAPVSYDGAYETTRATNFILTDNFIVARTTIGYGLNYGLYRWNRINHDYDTDPFSLPPSKKDSHALGFNLTLHHQVDRLFEFGASYSPTVYNIFPEAKSMYQHVISIEFVVKIPLNRSDF